MTRRIQLKIKHFEEKETTEIANYFHGTDFVSMVFRFDAFA